MEKASGASELKPVNMISPGAKSVCACAAGEKITKQKKRKEVNLENILYSWVFLLYMYRKMTKLSDLIGGQNYHSAPRFRRDMCNEKVKEKMGFWDGPSSLR